MSDDGSYDEGGVVRWGILGTAAIARRKVVPGMRKAEGVELEAIASRDAGRARDAAARLGIPRWHASYEALLEDPEVDAVYIPLPNHLHVPWARRALEAGKHVLVEKPVGRTAAEARELLGAARARPELKVMEAFMYRHHPQWRRARELAQEGGVGELRSVHAHFAYRNRDPNDVRNQADIGGGGLLDIGCYCVSLARFLYDAEPRRVVALVERDPELGVDRLASALLEFAAGTATFTCGTQLEPYQRVLLHGTEGRVELEIPFNAPQDGPTRLWHQRAGRTVETVFDRTDQYALQAELMSESILRDTPVPTPLEDAVANLEVLDAILASADGGGWVGVGRGG